MLLGNLILAFSKITKSKGNDDDGIDQMHHFTSVAIFMAFAAITGAKNYVGDPIHCWNPAHFHKSHKSYAESYCYIHHMYNVPMDEPIPVNVDKRFERDISFYRWVPVLFLLQALLFKVPNILWNQLKVNSGINVSKIVAMSQETLYSRSKDREKKIKIMAACIKEWLLAYRDYKNNILIRVRKKVFSNVVCFMFGKRQGTFLTGLYLFCKCLFFANVIGQFFMLSKFLDIDFSTYGFNILNVLTDEGHWEDLEEFPRIAMCDFEIRQLQNIQRYTLQCVLSINLFVEKMYAFTWFWLFALSVATAINVVKWIFDIFFRKRREQFMEKHMILLNADTKRERSRFLKFVNEYLRDDGVFVIRAVRMNVGDMLALDLVKQLWEDFQELRVFERQDG